MHKGFILQFFKIPCGSKSDAGNLVVQAIPRTLVPEIEPLPNSCQYPLINYIVSDDIIDESDIKMADEVDHEDVKFDNEVEIKCDICVLEFSSLEVLDMHNCEQHEDASGMKQCHYCNSKVKTFNALKIHIDNKHPEHGEKKHFCNKCDESFIFQSSLKSHKIRHKVKQKKDKEKKRAAKCDICVLEFATCKLQTAHNREKHENGLCQYCNHKMGSLSNLKNHIDTKHPEHGEKKVFCEHCGKGFIFKVSLSFHMTMKHRDKKMCEICGKELTKGNLKNHMLIQHGIRPKDMIDVVCEICGFSTPSKQTLFAHKHSQHQMEKHKKCPHCDYTSPYKQKLNIHIDRNHPGVRWVMKFPIRGTKINLILSKN